MKAIVNEQSDGNKYITFSTNGNGQVTWTTFVSSDPTKTTGVGDTHGLTISIDLMSGKNNTFPKGTMLRIDRQGMSENQTGSNGNVTNAHDAGGSPELVSLNADGSIKLSGTAIQYGNLKTNVIAAAGTVSNTTFENVKVYIDFANMRMMGYLNGQLTAVTSLPSTLRTDYYLAAMDVNKNTRFTVALYTGYNGSAWNVNDAKAASVEIGGVSTPLFDADANEGNGAWNAAAIAKYVDENFYFSFDNLQFIAGDAVNTK